MKILAPLLKPFKNVIFGDPFREEFLGRLAIQYYVKIFVSLMLNDIKKKK